MGGCGPEISEFQCFLINIGLNLSYILIAIGILLALLFPIIYIIRHPKQAGGTLLGIGVVAVIFLIAYGIAADNTVTYREIIVEGTQSKLVGGGIITMYVFVILAALGLVATEVKSLFD